MKKLCILLVFLVSSVSFVGCGPITTVITTGQPTTSLSTTEIQSSDTSATYSTTDPIVNELRYGLRSNGEIVIIGYLGESTSLIIPESIDGHPVTEIAASAFDHANLEFIDIPPSVTTIGDRAFIGTPWLDRMTDEYPVLVINDILIDGQKATGVVTIPNGVQRIPRFAFEGASITSVILPDSVTNISDHAFYNSTLSSIVLSSNLLYIGEGAFENSLLLEISIPNSVTLIDQNAFKDSLLQSITFEEGSTLDAIGTFAFSHTHLESIIIPISVRVIQNLAFWHNDGLTIYAEASEQPLGWSRGWNTDDYPVVWGYQEA